jgi:tetratricopeptide (TPR) repeat protein
VYARLNQPDKARRMYDLFHRRQEVRRKLDDTRMQLGARPKDGEIYATIADLEMQIGDRAEAISVLQAGLQADPKNAKLRKWLSQLTPPSRVDGAPSQ